MTSTSNSVQVGPFRVADASAQSVIDAMSAEFPGKSVAYALHVGGLNHRNSAEFVQEMRRADIVYADGMAVVAMAKLAGATKIERAATTDIGIEVLRRLSLRLGRPARISIVGGDSGVAERAGVTLITSAGVDIVFATHGFHGDYADVVGRIRDSSPDCVIVGLGMPREAIWVRDHWDDLPDALVVTCGGWLGFLAGNESRAPQWMRTGGIEWFYRLMQSPRRLFRRYGEGLATTMVLVPGQIKSRFSPK